MENSTRKLVYHKGTDKHFYDVKIYDVHNVESNENYFELVIDGKTHSLYDTMHEALDYVV